jgi:hypothetical protein
MSLEQAMERAEELIRDAAERAVRLFAVQFRPPNL